MSFVGKPKASWVSETGTRSMQPACFHQLHPYNRLRLLQTDHTVGDWEGISCFGQWKVSFLKWKSGRLFREISMMQAVIWSWFPREQLIHRDSQRCRDPPLVQQWISLLSCLTLVPSICLPARLSIQLMHAFLHPSPTLTIPSPLLLLACPCFALAFRFQYLASSLHLFLLIFSVAVTLQSPSLPQLCPLRSVPPKARGPLLLKHNSEHIFVWRHAWKSGFCSGEMQTIINVWKRKAYFVYGIDISRLLSIVHTESVCSTQQAPGETQSVGTRPVTHPLEDLALMKYIQLGPTS